MTTNDEPVVYTAAELLDFKAGLDEFFATQAQEEYEVRIDVRPSGWSSHFKLVKRLPAVTPNLTAVANITHPAFIAQLVDQLISVIEDPHKAVIVEAEIVDERDGAEVAS